MRFRLLSAGASNGLTPRRPRSFYTANGDNHSQRPDRFKRLLEIAKKHNGEFNIDAVNELYGQNAELSLSNNPKLYMEGYTLVVIVSPALLPGVELGRRLTGIGTIPAARSLSDQYVCAFPPSQTPPSDLLAFAVPEFFSNGTYGAGGAPTLENIAPLMGFKVRALSFACMQTVVLTALFQINDDGSLCAVPEQIPANWYRRSTPYGIANVVANAPGTFASGRALPSPISNIIQSGNADEIGCFLYQLLSSESPASVTLGTTDGVSSLLTGLQNQLLGGLPVSAVDLAPSRRLFADCFDAFADYLRLLRRQGRQRIEQPGGIRRLASGAGPRWRPGLDLHLSRAFTQSVWSPHFDVVIYPCHERYDSPSSERPEQRK